jgi:hypothetical protein
MWRQPLPPLSIAWSRDCQPVCLWGINKDTEVRHAATLSPDSCGRSSRAHKYGHHVRSQKTFANREDLCDCFRSRRVRSQLSTDWRKTPDTISYGGRSLCPQWQRFEIMRPKLRTVLSFFGSYLCSSATTSSKADKMRQCGINAWKDCDNLRAADIK